MMDTILSLINAAACGLIALALVGAVLSARVHDGVIIKAGLVSMALGFGSIAMRLVFDRDNALGLGRSLLMINAGIAVVIIGYLLRRARGCQQMRRSTDWGRL